LWDEENPGGSKKRKKKRSAAVGTILEGPRGGKFCEGRSKREGKGKKGTN